MVSVRICHISIFMPMLVNKKLHSTKSKHHYFFLILFPRCSLAAANIRLVVVLPLSPLLLLSPCHFSPSVRLRPPYPTPTPPHLNVSVASAESFSISTCVRFHRETCLACVCELSAIYCLWLCIILSVFLPLRLLNAHILY